MGGVTQTMDSGLLRYDGGLDAASSILTKISEATSESLGFLMKVLLIAFCVATEASCLHLLSRAIHGISVEYSGQINGDSNPEDGRIKLVLLWSWLSRKNRFNVPWVSVLVPVPISIVLLLVRSSIPAATSTVSIPRKPTWQSLTLSDPPFYIWICMLCYLDCMDNTNHHQPELP
jgi:hypothetical protein